MDTVTETKVAIPFGAMEQVYTEQMTAFLADGLHERLRAELAKTKGAAWLVGTLDEMVLLMAMHERIMLGMGGEREVRHLAELMGLPCNGAHEAERASN